MLSHALILAIFLIFNQKSFSAPLRVACASSFAPVLKKILKTSNVEQLRHTMVIPGSTGKLFAQIVNGAPFNIFLAADTEHPQLLKSLGRNDGESFIYAKGQLPAFFFTKECV